MSALLIDVRSHDSRVGTADLRRTERRAADMLARAPQLVQQVTVRFGTAEGGDAAGRSGTSCRIVVRCTRHGYTAAEAKGPDPMAALERCLARLQRALRHPVDGGIASRSAG